MLYTYTAAKGYKAGAVYVLPAEQQRKSGLGGADDSYQPARTVGKHYGAGTGTPFFSSGTRDCIFIIDPGFAATKSWWSNAMTDLAAVETAAAEFREVVVKGGLGTLIDSPPTGYKVVHTDGTMQTCTQRTCTARVVAGSIDEEWQDSGTVCLFGVTLECPVGFWTCTNALGTCYQAFGG